MSDYGYDSDEFDLYDDGWLYIAEEDHLADDLAERAVASPPPRDYDIDGSGYGSDYFEYWVDIEYNSDGWNDVRGAPKTDIARKNTPGSKKRKKVAQRGPSQKKRKGPHGRKISPAPSAAGNQLSPVRWQSRKERTQQDFREARALSEEPASFALLQDWRTRFGSTVKDAKGKMAKVEAAENQDAGNQIMKAMEKAMKAEEEEEEAEGDGPLPAQSEVDGLESLLASSGLDPQALMRALEENLASLGAVPADLDRSTLMEYVLRMFSGEGEADDIAGQLAEDMFERAEEDDPEGKQIAEWAAKQKGKPESGDQQESADGKVEASGPKRKNRAVLPPTPPAGQDETSGAETQEKRKASKEPAASTVADGSRSRKRKASEPAPDDEPPPRSKRATRSYAAPTSSSKSKATTGKGAKGKRG
ncbi:hypothetical protein MPH_07709 [Macrophomina phaseolina MS6]|uniref:Uncharacterized protein n=2 Tax=Macrophomina phaseolina TaxID=35725 RepID=K2RQS5_MACPH|nr:hypothetical protein MPH_07709 [Macrophomina phaseolina MS6]KAH7063121.1 hypothetical protein B0J12DRAFT_158461 [Macrophomina phaseolina]